VSYVCCWATSLAFSQPLQPALLGRGRLCEGPIRECVCQCAVWLFLFAVWPSQPLQPALIGPARSCMYVAPLRAIYGSVVAVWLLFAVRLNVQQG